jgi:hypothetical protein
MIRNNTAAKILPFIARISPRVKLLSRHTGRPRKSVPEKSWCGELF